MPLASELNPALDRYYCCRLDKSDMPRRAKLIREPIIRYDRDLYLFYKGYKLRETPLNAPHLFVGMSNISLKSRVITLPLLLIAFLTHFRGSSQLFPSSPETTVFHQLQHKRGLSRARRSGDQNAGTRAIDHRFQFV